MKKTGLIIVDMQEALVNEKTYNKENVINNLKILINECRKKNIEIIYIRHDGGTDDELEFGSKGWQIYNEIAPKEGDKIVEKKYNSAFKNTELKSYLDEKNIETIILVGMMTEYCMDATCKVAFEYGYNLIVPEETNTTYDNEYMSGKEIYEYYNFKIWKNRFVKLYKMSELLESEILNKTE